MSKREAKVNEESVVEVPKRLKPGKPDPIEKLVQEANRIAHSETFGKLAAADLISKFAGEYKTFSKKLHHSVYLAAAALHDVAANLMQMAELQIAARFLEHKGDLESFLKADCYEIANDPKQALKRGVCFLLVGLAGQREFRDPVLAISDTCSLPLDSSTVDLLVSKTDVENVLPLWSNLVVDFEKVFDKKKLPEESYCAELDVYTREVLVTKAPPARPYNVCDGFLVCSRIKAVIAALEANRPFAV